MDDMGNINLELIERYKNDRVLDRQFYEIDGKDGSKVVLDGIVNPLKIDNRQLVSPMDDQGNVPGCAGWSACTLMESEYWKQTGKLVQLDAKHVYAKAKTLDGQPSEDGTYLECSLSAALELCGNDFIGKRKVKTFHRQGNDTIEMVKFLIHKYDFVQVGFNIDEGWYRCTNQDYVLRKYGRSYGGHAVLMVGFDTQGFYICNQWGTGWGAKGFAIIPYDLFLEEFMYGAYLEFD